MKKTFYFTLFIFFVTLNIYSGGIVEYNGKNYVYSIYSGGIAAAYSAKENLSEYNLNPAVYDKKLYFIGPMQPLKLNDIILRGHIQSGDKFFISDNYPNTNATYNGPKKDISDSQLVLSKKDNAQICWGIGYSNYGGNIIITDLIVNEKELKILKSKLKEIKQ